MRRAAIGAGLALALAACAPDSSGGGRGSPPTAAAPFELELRAERPAGGSAAALRAGEPVALVLRVRNTSGAVQRISCSSARTYDFAVAGPDGSELWRHSLGRMYAQMLTEIVFEPGEEKEFRATWEPASRPETRLAPGSYRVRGWLESTDPAEARPLELVLE